MSVWILVVVAGQAALLALLGGAIWYVWRMQANAASLSANASPIKQEAVQELLEKALEIVKSHSTELNAFGESLNTNVEKKSLDSREFRQDVERIREANSELEERVDTTVEAITSACGDMMEQEQDSLGGYQTRTRDFDALLRRASDNNSLGTLANQLMEMVIDLREENKTIRAEIAESHSQTVELLEKAHRAERTARVDALTRLPNRRAFDEHHEDLAHSHDQHPYSVILIDIDFFKSVNDEYGHAGGDSVLTMIARILREGRRTSDFVCRLGGEEFAVLLPNCREDAALTVAEKIRTRVKAAKLHLGDQRVSVTVSCGVAESRENESRGRLLERSDAALYDAKNKGRNCSRIASELECDAAPVIRPSEGESAEMNAVPVGSSEG